MPSRITIACEHCGAKLTLADDSKLGKKIKCPKCSEIFVAATDDDDIEDFDDDEDDVEEARPKRKAATTGAAKGAKAKGGKGKKQSGSNLGLIIGGAVAVGVLLVGGLIGVLFATGVIGGGAPKSNPNQIVMAPFQPGAPAGNPGAPPGLPGPPGETPSGATPPGATPPGASPSTSAAAPTNPAASTTPMPTTPMPTSTKAADPAPSATDAAPPIPARSAVPETAKWLPADAELIIHIKVADILTSPLVSEILKSNQLDSQLDAALAPFGLKAADVDSITSGVSKLNEIAQQVQQMQMSLMMGQTPSPATSQPPSLGVVKLKKPMTYEVIQQLPSPIPLVKQQHAGKDYLVMTEPTSSLSSGVWLASETEVVVGDNASVQAAMERGGSSSTLPNFGFVDWTKQLTIAVAPNDLAAVRNMKPPQSTGNPMFDQMIDTFAEGTSGVSLGMTVQGGITVEIAFGCVDQPKMEAIIKSLNDAVGLGKLQYDQAKQGIPPWAATFTNMLVENVTVVGENRVAVLSTNLPDSMQQQLAQLPAMIMAQVAISAMTSGSPAGSSSVAISPDAGLVNELETIPDEAPENVKLTASLTPSPTALASAGAAKSKAKKKERMLDLAISARWTGEKDGCLLAAAGVLKPKGGAAADSTKIKVALPKAGGEAQPNTLRPVSLADFDGPTVPLGQLQLTIADNETAPLKSVSGVCTVVTGTQVKQVTLPDVRSLDGQEPADEDLKAAGLQIKIVRAKSGEGDQVLVTVKEGFLLSSLEAIDAAGNPASVAAASADKNERTQRLDIVGDKMGVQAYLYTDLKSVTVPFTFENLPVPPALEQQPSTIPNVPGN